MSKYILKNIQNHTPNTYTQGLLLHDNILYESSGLYSKSFVQKYINSNTVVRRGLPSDVFAEGICILNNILYCLTWQKSEMFAFDLDLNLIYNKKFILDECWGLTTDGKYFIVSDGSNRIYWINPVNYDIIKVIKLNIDKINALTYIDNYLYANIYQSNHIIKISIRDSQIINKWDMSFIAKLEPKADLGEYVLNGITHLPNSNNDFYITGKHWDKIYLVELNH
jgi:glutamine cyclotransferase